jgi:tight adherence protein B
MLFLAAFLVFLSLALAGYAITGVSVKQQEAAESIRRRLYSTPTAAPLRDAPPLLKDQRLSSIPLLNRLLGRIAPVTRLVQMIRQAGLTNRVGEVLLYIPLLAALGVLGGMLITGNPLISAVLAGLGGAIPLLVVQRKRRTRMRKFSEQLPDALDLLRAALQAGHSFVTALYVVADEFPDPIAEELRTVAEEIRLGMPTRDALYRLRNRVDDANVPILVVGIMVAQDIGGNLAEVLDNICHTIRERFKILRDVQVMTAQGRLSGMVLTALPVLVGLFMYFLNPFYFKPMLETQTGNYMIGYALLSLVAGHIVIQRIVRIHV